MRDRKKKLKKCVYCGMGKEAGQMSAEHFVPKCLWGDARPSTLVTVPAHVKCNNQFAADNEYFRTVVAFDGMDAFHPAATHVIAGPVTRSMLKRPKQFLNMTKDFDFRPRYSETGVYLGHQPSFSIDQERIERVVGNIVRGLYYDLLGHRVRGNREIYVEQLYSEILDEKTRYFVDQMSEWFGFGDDVFMVRYGIREDLSDICCLMQFYRNRTFFGATWDPTECRR